MPSLLFGDDLVVRTRTPNGQHDGYGVEQFDVSEVTVQGSAVYPTLGQEAIAGTDQLTADITFYLPYGTDITYLSEVDWNGDTYQVQGRPRAFRSCFTGTEGVTEVYGRLVSGGGPA